MDGDVLLQLPERGLHLRKSRVADGHAARRVGFSRHGHDRLVRRQGCRGADGRRQRHAATRNGEAVRGDRRRRAGGAARRGRTRPQREAHPGDDPAHAPLPRLPLLEQARPEGARRRDAPQRHRGHGAAQERGRSTPARKRREAHRAAGLHLLRFHRGRYGFGQREPRLHRLAARRTAPGGLRARRNAEERLRGPHRRRVRALPSRHDQPFRDVPAAAAADRAGPLRGASAGAGRRQRRGARHAGPHLGRVPRRPISN